MAEHNRAKVTHPDTARLDWLEAGFPGVDRGNVSGRDWWQVQRLDGQGRHVVRNGDTLRGAIDAAMRYTHPAEPLPSTDTTGRHVGTFDDGF